MSCPVYRLLSPAMEILTSSPSTSSTMAGRLRFSDALAKMALRPLRSNLRVLAGAGRFGPSTASLWSQKACPGLGGRLRVPLAAMLAGKVRASPVHSPAAMRSRMRSAASACVKGDSVVWLFLGLVRVIVLGWLGVLAEFLREALQVSSLDVSDADRITEADNALDDEVSGASSLVGVSPEDFIPRREFFDFTKCHGSRLVRVELVALVGRLIY